MARHTNRYRDFCRKHAKFCTLRWAFCLPFDLMPPVKPHSASRTVIYFYISIILKQLGVAN